MSLRGVIFPEFNIAAIGAGESRRRICLLPSSVILPHTKATVWRRSLSRPRSLLVKSSQATGELNKPSHQQSHDNRLLRLGSLHEDGLYKEKFMVRCYEVGINKTATMQTIASYLQEVSSNHLLSLGYSTDGFSTTHSMRKLNLIWVTSCLHIEVYKYPVWHDVVEIETWFQCDQKISFRNDWIIKDYATAQIIGRATGWMMMNSATRRLQKLTNDVRNEIHQYSSKSLRLAFPEENTVSLTKIRKLDEPIQHSKLGLVSKRADLDMNQHVNNVTYIGWLLESMPQEIIYSHELQSLTLDYRRECQHEDVIDSLASPESTVTSEARSQHQEINGEDENDFLLFRHSLRLSRDGSETNRGKTLWRKKPNAKNEHNFCMHNFLHCENA